MGAIQQSLIGRQAGGSDPFWANVVSLLWFNGNLTDERGKTWTANNGASTSSAQSKFGGSSLLLTNTQSIETAASTDFDFPGQFCFDGWFYFASFGSITEIFSRNGVFGGLYIYVTSGGVVTVDQTGSGTIISAAAQPLSLNTWQHVAVSRDGSNNLRIFIGGALINGLGGVTNNFSAAAAKTFIGPTVSASVHIDDWRITKGAARYTNTFTPPTFQAPNS